MFSFVEFKIMRACKVSSKGFLRVLGSRGLARSYFDRCNAFMLPFNSRVWAPRKQAPNPKAKPPDPYPNP